MLYHNVLITLLLANGFDGLSDDNVMAVSATDADMLTCCITSSYIHTSSPTAIKRTITSDALAYILLPIVGSS